MYCMKRLLFFTAQYLTPVCNSLVLLCGFSSFYCSHINLYFKRYMADIWWREGCIISSIARYLYPYTNTFSLHLDISIYIVEGCYWISGSEITSSPVNTDQYVNFIGRDDAKFKHDQSVCTSPCFLTSGTLNFQIWLLLIRRNFLNLARQLPDKLD